MAEKSHVSKVIRERALAILRETRSKIDPRLLDAMKDRIGETMPQVKDHAYKPRAERQTVFQSEKKFVPPVIDEVAPFTASAEPVDKQKIAQIVLHYMKLREDKQKH